MKVYKIRPYGLNGCCSEDNFEALKEWFDAAEIGEKFEVQVLEMTEDEYNALPEFTGP